MADVRAPYNFVPFSNEVLYPYLNSSALPPVNALDSRLHTGEIHITLTADTPVLVADTNSKEARFRMLPDGRAEIPGSSVRGMIRQNVQVLGLSQARPAADIADRRMFYRVVGKGSKSIAGKLKANYAAILGKSSKIGTLPRNVKAGYLVWQNGHYEILPTQRPYLRILRTDIPKEVCADPEHTFARELPIRYRVSADTCQVYPPDSEVDGTAPGVLLLTGRAPCPRGHHAYVIPQTSESKTPEVVSEADILSYQTDLEFRANSLNGLGYDKEFWELPEPGKRKAVFYIKADAHVYFARTLYPRIGYTHTICQGLPDVHRGIPDGIDYVRAIFGFAERSDSYRSRLSFGDFRSCKSVDQPSAPVYMIPGEPKPSFYAGYVVDGKHFSDDSFQLRGYKSYWLKKEQSSTGGNPNVTRKLYPLPKGTEFTGILRFRSLREDELGLLLWALRLEDGCYQQIGMGKPYGYGRVKLQIDRLLELDFEKLYGSNLLASPFISRTEGIDGYIDEYKAHASRISRSSSFSIQERSEIRDFFYLHSTIWKDVDQVSYMALREYQNPRHVLPTVRELRNPTPVSRSEQESSPPATRSALEQLASKFKAL